MRRLGRPCSNPQCNSTPTWDITAVCGTGTESAPARLTASPSYLVRSRAPLSHRAVQAVTRRQLDGCILDDARFALLQSRPSRVSHPSVSPTPKWWNSCAVVVTCSLLSPFASLVWQRHTGVPVSPQARITMRLLPKCSAESRNHWKCCPQPLNLAGRSWASDWIALVIYMSAACIRFPSCGLEARRLPAFGDRS